MSSLIASAPAQVANLDAASAQLFEECVSQLTEIVDHAGQPLESISHHPSIRPIMRKMRTLLNQMENFDTLAEDNADGHIATVTDISSRFQAN